MNYAEALSAETVALMEADPRMIILGVGVGDSRYGGKDIYGSMVEATRRFPRRVIDTPLSETMLTGACVGLAAEGWHPWLIHQRADFTYLSAEHLLNTAATWRMIHGTACPITVRAIIGEGWGCGPMHSKAPLEMWNVPGIDLFTPRSYHGIRRAYRNALATGNPTVIMERRRYYGQPLEEGDESEPRVDWTIPRGPAPASAPLEAAYYRDAVVHPQGGPF